MREIFLRKYFQDKNFSIPYGRHKVFTLTIFYCIESLVVVTFSTFFFSTFVFVFVLIYVIEFSTRSGSTFSLCFFMGHVIFLFSYRKCWKFLFNLKPMELSFMLIQLLLGDILVTCFSGEIGEETIPQKL